MPKAAFPFVTRFRNRRTGSQLQVELAVPAAMTDAEGRGYWSCPYRTNFDGVESTGQGYGDDWLQSLLLAYEGATKSVVENEADWEDEKGVDAYILIPKLVPISWGYDFYKRLYDHNQDEERALNAAIEERRTRSKRDDS